MSSKNVEPHQCHGTGGLHRSSGPGGCESQECGAKKMSSINADDSNNRGPFTPLSAYQSPGKQRGGFVPLPNPHLDILGDNEPQPHLPIPRPLATNVVKALRVFQTLYAGRTPKKIKQCGALRLSLSSYEYDQLFQAVQEDASLRRWVEGERKLFEYYPRDESLLIYMMAHPKHERMTAGLTKAFIRSLDILCEDARPEVARFARRIDFAGAPKVQLRDSNNNKIKLVSDNF